MCLCVCICVPVCGNLPSPLFAWFSFFANRKVAFLTCHTLLPPMNGLCNQHFFKYSSSWCSSASDFQLCNSPESGSRPCPAAQVGILSQYSQLMGEHCRLEKQRHGSSATGFSGRSMKPLTEGHKVYFLIRKIVKNCCKQLFNKTSWGK